jgi:hypothetical protein
MKEINYIIGIGLRCATDGFLLGNKLRLFSTPFSFMIIDFETAIENIINSFDGYLQLEHIINLEEDKGGNIKKIPQFGNIKVFKTFSVFTLGRNLFFNIKYLPKNISDDLHDWDRVCVFNHHDFNDPNIVKSFERRIQRVQTILKNHKEDTLLLYIDRQIKLSEVDERVKMVTSIINRYNADYNICYLTPINDYQGEPILYAEVDKLKLFIMGTPDRETTIKDGFNDTDYGYAKVKWKIFEDLFRQHYSFNLFKCDVPQNYKFNTLLKSTYNNLLFRDPTDQEYNNLRQVSIDEFPTEHLIYIITSTEEYKIKNIEGRKYDAAIKQAYNTILSREPDDEGCNYYRRMLAQGNITEAQMINGMKLSEEYKIKNKK